MYSAVQSSHNASSPNSVQGPARGRTVVSPIRPLAVLSVIVPVFVILVYVATAWHSLSPAGSSLDGLGPASKASVFNVSWAGAYPPERTAYVYSLTHGRWDDKNRLLGVRTGIETLRHTGTRRDIVVMVSDDVPEDVRATLLLHGAILAEMPSLAHRKDDKRAGQGIQIPSPIASSSTAGLTGADPVNDALTHAIPRGGPGQCRAEFGALHAWGLYGQYDRVVYLEPDHIPVLLLDELFLCGKFCVIYSSLTWYQTAVLVIEPNKQRHAEVFQSLVANGIDPSTLASPSADDCATAWEDFLLREYPHMGSSPLFAPSAGQQHDPAMRLQAGYAINPIFWYEKYGWVLVRVKEYAAMTGTTVFEVPAHGVGWPRNKPYRWFNCLYFNVHWIWQWHRSVLLKESFSTFLITWGIIVAAAVFFAGTPLEKLVLILTRPPRDPLPNVDNDLAAAGGKGGVSAASSASSGAAAVGSGGASTGGVAGLLARVTGVVGWNVPGLVIGCSISFACAAIVHALIPDDVIYYYAWPVFLIAWAVLSGVALRLFALLVVLPIVGTAAWNSSSTAALPAPPATMTSFWVPSDAGQAPGSLLAYLSHDSASLTPQAFAHIVRRVTDLDSVRLPLLVTVSLLISHHGDIFAHFVLKIIIMYSLILLSFLLFARPYCHLMRAIFFYRAGLGRWRTLAAGSVNF